MAKSESYRRAMKKYYARTAFSRNYKKPWDSTEERLIMRHEVPDRELAELLGRSVGSIQQKRARLKAAGYDFNS